LTASIPFAGLTASIPFEGLTASIPLGGRPQHEKMRTAFAVLTFAWLHA